MNPILVALTCVVIGAVIVFFLLCIQSRIQKHFLEIESRLKQESEKFVQTANERFIDEQFKSKALLEQNKQAVEHHVDHLTRELERITKLIREFEADRIYKFASLDEKLAQTAVATRSLSETTQKLGAVIGNNQLRGQWGQKMAEDILRAAGFSEGFHYFKEKTQETVSTRPDFVFPLPDQHKVYMDVKFPLNNYQAFMDTEDKNEKERTLGDFIKDVKNRIRELKKRDYINPEEQTLDYVILFIPNEQIFGFIHRTAPELMDEALSQKVLLASPYSLYGILSIIRQAYDNFFFKKSTYEILKLITQFLDDYENFKKRFVDVGELLGKTQEKYDDVSDKSFKKLDQRIKKLEEFRKGQEPQTPEFKEAVEILNEERVPS
ncbi:MAG: hypothetical protein A3C47_03940 [Omnitrophica bacterium RIFCSPHIGHO2_02_FULL_51_18]|nr:MAG: hypothetical protein A3C47_03940 [Omnitrophica bacterium RIFCSPHIGHO2_02_FULL_51_18]